MSTSTSVVWLSDVDTKLHTTSKHGKMLAELTQATFPVLPGFLITVDAYFDFLQKNLLDYKIRQLLGTVAIHLPDSLMQTEPYIKRLFIEAHLSKKLEIELTDFYKNLGSMVTLEVHTIGNNAVKHLTLHADTKTLFIEQIKEAWAAMFTAQALWNQHQHKQDHLQTGVEIVVQKKIVGDKTGTIYTIDPITHAKDRLIISIHTPHAGDRYVISKKTLAIIDRQLKHKTNVSKLTYNEILAIADMAKEIEQHLYFPQEMTWAIADEMLYLVHTKPINTLQQTIIEQKRKLPIARGKGITTTIGTGVTKIILSLADLHKASHHDVIVIADVQLIHMPYLKKVRALLVEKGHQHTEIATLLRQQGIPTIFHVTDATKHFHNGHIITVHAGKGEVYHGGFA